MGTIIQSSIDFGFANSWPEGEPAGAAWKGPNRSDRNQRRAKRLSALEEVLHWKNAAPDGADDFLDAQWKKVTEQVGNLVKGLQRQSAKQIVPSGATKIVSDNLSLMKQALIESRPGIQKADRLPHVCMRDSTTPVPRPFALAAVYLRSTGYEFDEAAFARFLTTVQESLPLEMLELWNLKALLEIVLLTEIANETAQSELFATRVDSSDEEKHKNKADRLSALLNSLQTISDIEWKLFFEAVCATEKILRMDPVCAYEKMDSATREMYRAAVADFAARSKQSEQDVARKAIDLARLSQESPCSSERSREKRSHVGYYLIDAGQAALKKEIGYRPSLAKRIQGSILESPDFFYFVGIELFTFGIIALLVSFLHLKLHGFWTVALFLLPALECAVATVNMLATRIVPPRRIPKLDFSKGIPDNCATVVAVPTLLTSEAQARQAVLGLEVRFLANQDRNLHFALLTDLPDSTQQFDEKESLVELSAQLVRELDEKYAHEDRGRFFLLHRNRTYNQAEDLWMGWERKRGKLLDFNRFLLNQGDPYPVKAGGDASVLKNARFVITLDLDTQLPLGAGLKLVGTMAHPLNRAIIDPVKNVVSEGYGILQPRVDISVKSASRSRFASLLSGDTGFDIYTRAVSDVYQDLFGEGIFTGKGIYEVETFQKVLEHRFPCNAVLSHDLIEGVYARAGLVSDVEVVDDYPSHFSAFSRRKHRWVRGDWQILFSLLPRFENHFGEMVFNPMSHISRWKIFDNLRRSLTEFAIMLLLLCGWMLLPGDAFRWTIAALGVIIFPPLFQVLLAVFTAGKAWFRRDFWQSLCRDFAAEVARICVRLAFLCHQSLIDLDAIVRTLVRMKFTHRRLLEWETAADAEVANGGENIVDVYLRCSLMITVGMAPLVFLFHPNSLAIATPFLFLWAGSAWIGEWLNRPQNTLSSRIKPKDREMIQNAALRTWRFFRQFSNAGENWLIPDIVQEAPPLFAHRISPTNLGLLLNSRLAAHDLGYLTMPEFIRDTELTLDTAARMPKRRGHFYNWYETDSLEPVAPLFLSTVDNGNLVSSLWTLNQGCLEMMKKPLLHPALWTGLRDHAAQLAETVQQNCVEGHLDMLALDLKQLAGEIHSEDQIRMDELRALEIDALIFLNRASKGGNDEVVWWAREFSARVTSLLNLFETYVPWLVPHFEGACPMPEAALPAFLKTLTLESLPRIYREMSRTIAAQAGGAAADGRTKHFLASLDKAIRVAEDLAKRVTAVAAASQSMADEMDFSFLYDEKKKLFSIGYEDGEPAISKYNYDLLASEARTAVFIAIAKGEAPQESWFHLKRTFRSYKREVVLLSWSGTAFEYLMPCLWLRSYPSTLLERSVQAVIRAQKKFGDENEIPWGISESSCAQRNPDGHYMYHAFGVPGVALHKDDCSGDLVVAPYATFLSLMFDVEGAVENLRRLKDFGLQSSYGYYEAADFTPKRNTEEGGHVIVRNWMAHHQGMILVAASNVLCDSAMQRRFHADPRVAAIERLLHEKQPRVVPFEEDTEAISESSPALADMASQIQHPGFRDLVPKLL